MAKKHSSPRLAPIDLSLARELGIDARQSAPTLARKVGVSHKTVLRRLRRMTDHGILRFIALPHPDSMGLRIYSALLINANPGEVQAVAEQLAQHKRIVSVGTTAGRFDIIAWAIFRDTEHMFKYLASELCHVSGIESSETITLIKYYKMSWTRLNGDNPYPKLKTQYKLDPLDMRLMARLQVNPRETISHLANELDASRSMIRNRLQKLLNAGTVKLFAMVESSALGYPTRATALIKVRPGKLVEVADRLANHHATMTVLITAGRYDIVANLRFEDNTQMLTFVTDELNTIPGIMSHDIVVNLGFSKSVAT